MKIAICDDDRDFGIQTKRMVCEALERRDVTAEIKTFADARMLLGARRSGIAFDAYLLDVIMPGMDGLALARTIRRTQPQAPIAFLTTSEDYALQAFSVDAAHYLLKPLDMQRLETALDRLVALLPKSGAAGLDVRTSDGDLRTVPLTEIVLAEADGHYWRLRLSDGMRVRHRISGRELWEMLSATGQFVQANKGVVLNVAHIRSLSAAGAVLANGETVAVSRRAFPEVRKVRFRYNCR